VSRDGDDVPRAHPADKISRCKTNKCERYGDDQDFGPVQFFQNMSLLYLLKLSYSGPLYIISAI